MSSATPSANADIDIPSLLRFLTQTASVPLSIAMSKIPSLRAANIASSALIAAAPIKTIKEHIFPEDEKRAKQVHSAAKREMKKRKEGGDGDEATAQVSPAKRRRKGDAAAEAHEEENPVQKAAALEAKLALPDFDTYFPNQDTPDKAIDLLDTITLITNRAPLLLAFTLVLLEYTMPEQPLSGRLSLAQAIVSEGARKRAKDLGIDTSAGGGAEAEGWGQGQPSVRIMGRMVRVMRRWSEVAGTGIASANGDATKETIGDVAIAAEAGARAGDQAGPRASTGSRQTGDTDPQPNPPFWALDLEALKTTNSATPSSSAGNTSSLPIHQPHSARAYLLKSFASAPSSTLPTSTTIADSATASKPPRKPSKADADAHAKAINLALLLRALRLLFGSWIDTLGRAELDRRAWGWYVTIRPAVEEGKAGWGGKGEVSLKRVLELRRVVDETSEPAEHEHKA